MRKYADFLRQCVMATHSIRELTKLSDPRVMKCFPNALPESILEKWPRVAGAYKLESKLDSHELGTLIEREKISVLTV